MIITIFSLYFPSFTSDDYTKESNKNEIKKIYIFTALLLKSHRKSSKLWVKSNRLKKSQSRSHGFDLKLLFCNK